MSALGQKQTLRQSSGMSALPPKADIRQRGSDVRFVPIADEVHCSKELLFDHLVGRHKKARRHSKAERLRGLEVERRLILGRCLHRKVDWFGAS
jgi:hypothetical protein